MPTPVTPCGFLLNMYWFLAARCLKLPISFLFLLWPRGAEAPGKRGSYYEKDMTIKDWSCLILWSVVTFLFLWIGGVRA